MKASLKLKATEDAKVRRAVGVDRRQTSRCRRQVVVELKTNIAEAKQVGDDVITLPIALNVACAAAQKQETDFKTLLRQQENDMKAYMKTQRDQMKRNGVPAGLVRAADCRRRRRAALIGNGVSCASTSCAPSPCNSSCSCARSTSAPSSTSKRCTVRRRQHRGGC